MTSAWYIVRTATRREDTAIESLAALGVAHYMPRLTRWKRLQRPQEVDGEMTDKVKAEAPLYPGYMFALLAGDEDFHRVLEADGIHTLVASSQESGERRPFVVPAAAVHQIMLDERAGEFDRTRPTAKRYRPKRGDKVVVAGGPFMGYLATVISEITEKTKRARVELHGLGGGAMPLDLTHMAPAA